MSNEKHTFLIAKRKPLFYVCLLVFDGCLVLSELCGLFQSVPTGEPDSCLNTQEAFGTTTYDDRMHF